MRTQYALGSAKGVCVSRRTMSNPAADGVTRIGQICFVWRLDVDTQEGPWRLFYFQAQGGCMSAVEREAIFDYYRTYILAEEKPYIHLFDLKRGIDNIATHLLPLAEFCRTLHSQQNGRLRQLLLVSNNALTRGAIRCALRMTPPMVPFVLCRTEEEAWQRIAGSRGAIDPRRKDGVLLAEDR